VGAQQNQRHIQNSFTMSKSQRDEMAQNHVEFPRLILYLRIYFRHAPAVCAWLQTYVVLHMDMLLFA
jgi:hypothetical protein